MTVKDSSILEPLHSQRWKCGEFDDEILDMVESSEVESIAFQLCHSDTLYNDYFKNMNAGRLKVG